MEHLEGFTRVESDNDEYEGMIQNDSEYAVCLICYINVTVY